MRTFRTTLTLRTGRTGFAQRTYISGGTWDSRSARITDSGRTVWTISARIAR